MNTGLLTVFGKEIKEPELHANDLSSKVTVKNAV